jgi:hypothetical protein
MRDSKSGRFETKFEMPNQYSCHASHCIPVMRRGKGGPCGDVSRLDMFHGGARRARWLRRLRHRTAGPWPGRRVAMSSIRSAPVTTTQSAPTTGEPSSPGLPIAPSGAGSAVVPPECRCHRVGPGPRRVPCHGVPLLGRDHRHARRPGTGSARSAGTGQNHPLRTRPTHLKVAEITSLGRERFYDQRSRLVELLFCQTVSRRARWEG